VDGAVGDEAGAGGSVSERDLQPRAVYRCSSSFDLFTESPSSVVAEVGNGGKKNQIGELKIGLQSSHSF
jgi:hypothetical protein